MEFAMFTRFTGLVKEKGLEYAAQYAKELGLTGVEFLAYTANTDYCPIKNAEQAREAKKILDSYGLPVVCFSVCSNLWNEADAEQNLMSYVEITAALGCPYIHHTLLHTLSSSESEPTFEQVLEPVVASAARVADYAKTLGVTCIYEDQGFYFNGVRNFGMFYDAVREKCDNVGVCGDVGNSLFVGEDPAVFFETFAKDIRHVHIKDYLFRSAQNVPEGNWDQTKEGDWLKETVPGTGIVNLEACIQCLKNAGYDGVLSLESSYRIPFDVGVKQTIEYITRLWA